MKVYVVIRCSPGYYEDDYEIELEGVFSTQEKAQAHIALWPDYRHSMKMHEIVIDDSNSAKEIYFRWT